MARPDKQDYNVWYEPYISKTKGETVIHLINNHALAIIDFIEEIPEEKAEYKYADNKWTVKEVIQHLIDAERVFVYRAMRFARKDKTPLAGFEENDYIDNADTAKRSLQELKNEFHAVRMSTDMFLATLSNEQLSQTGTANNNATTVNAIAFIIFGHILHHKQVLEERYFN